MISFNTFSKLNLIRDVSPTVPQITMQDVKLTKPLEHDVVQLKTNPIVDDITNLKSLKLGEEINRGNDAAVYNIADKENYVIRIEHGCEFKPESLKLVNDESGYIIATNTTGSITLLKKVEGKPLYDKNWDIHNTPNINDYNKQLDEIMSLPDDTFKKYMNDIIKLRKSGFEIDTINPGNFLLDSKGNINFVDLSKNETQGKIKQLSIKDFYPFIDGKRISRIFHRTQTKETEILQQKIKNFLDRIINISKDNGTPVKIDNIDHNKLQDNITYIYHNDPLMYG